MRALFQPNTISSRFNACADDTGLGVAKVTVPCTPGAIT
jgi:hypothetical protein